MHTWSVSEYMCSRTLAKDYVEGMWRILQQSEPEDFVLATGETHPVREYVEKAFAIVNISIKYVQPSIKTIVVTDR
jgi:GDP-D-mannose dehydratase